MFLRLDWEGHLKGFKSSLVVLFLVSTLSVCGPRTPVSVSISPSSASVQVGQLQQFTAMVSGTTSTAVNWLVSGIAGGNSIVGTISSTGLYTAPQSVRTNSVTVTAQSTSALSALANATVSITASSSSINENLETVTLYVDPNGSDSNPGTQAQPKKTIQAAVSVAVFNNHNSIGTKVIINAGTYREKVYFNGTTTALPVTFQAATNGTVIISGSDVWTGWKQSGSSYTHSFPSIGGPCTPPNGWPYMPPIVFRREMIFVNGTPLTQVLSSSQLVVGTFYVDDTNNVVSIWPPTGTNMAAATVEVAQRSEDFDVSGATNIVFRGLTFEHSATCPNGGNALSINNSNYVLIDTDRFVWNNQTGLGFGTVNNVLVESSQAYHNGGSGWGADRGKNFTYSNDETSYNNWRNAQGAAYGWAYDGAKLLALHASDLNGFKSYYNQTGGIWFDTDNADITIENLDSSNNLTYGMFLEADEGPISITGSKLCNNKDNEVSAYSFGALISANAEYVTVRKTLFYNNAVTPGGNGGQILIGGSGSGRTFTNWETGKSYTVQSQNWTLSQDTFVGIGSLQAMVYSYLSGSVWTQFQGTFSSNYNTWWNASNAYIFHPVTGVYNFAGWQTYMNQDANSTFSDPSASCAAPTPDAPDYWLTTYFGGDTKTVTRGSSATYAVQIWPVGAFTNTVNLSVDGATQIGATAGPGQAFISGGSGSTTLSVNTSRSTSTGTFPITILATSGGVTRTLTLTLAVQ